MDHRLREALLAGIGGDERLVTWYPPAWQDLLECDAVEVPWLPEWRGQRTCRVSRCQLLRLAEVVRRGEASVRFLFVWAQVWGYGTVGYGSHRTRRLLASELARRDGRFPDALAAAWNAVNDSGAVEGYRILANEYWTKGFGPAFATKFLYFAGYEAPTDGPRPLILDSLVVRSLSALTDIGAKTVWNTDGYQHYVEFASACAEELGCRPDEVERSLFEYARRNRRSPAGLPATRGSCCTPSPIG